MSSILRPGTALMHRLHIAGKFGIVAALLIIPILTGMVSGYRNSSQAISQLDRARQGLAVVTPLSTLVVEMSRTHALGSPVEDVAWRELVLDVDRAAQAYGDELAIRGNWSLLRPLVLRAHDPGISSVDRIDSARKAAIAGRQLAKKVADSSALSLDRELDTHYLVAVLGDHAPRLMSAASDVAATRGLAQGPRADAFAMELAVRDFNDARRQLNLDLNSAVAATSWSGVREFIATPASGVNIASADFSTSLEKSPTPENLANAVNSLSGSVDDLIESLSLAVDHLLAQRQDQLASQRSRPLLFILATMVLVGYLMMALFRAISDDVRTVLGDISAMTTGGIHQTDPLSSADEFGQMSRAVVYARDRLTALVGALKYQATHDDLTALANRALFTEKVHEALSQDAGQVAVLLIDLDGFKDLNDSFGHDFGDRLLRMVAARVHRNVPRRSVVARLGSDEFAVLITDPRFTQDPADLIIKLSEALAQPLDVEGRSMRMRAGIGYVLSGSPSAASVDSTEPSGSSGPSGATAAPHLALPDEEGDPEALNQAIELIRNADVALSYAKQMGKGHQVRFEPRMHDHTRNRTELSADLLTALDEGQLYVVYQPLVDLGTNQLYGVEALLRWDHPTRGPISPDVFVPLAEATGQITSIGKWVLRRACLDLASWQQEYPAAHSLTMEVNLATEQLSDPGLVPDLRDVLEETAIDADLVVLEVTESTLVKDLEIALRRMAQLSALGVRIALDDFGTGYSSLSYLRRLPVTVMKIDKSFLRDDTAQGHALLRSIIDLGAGQGMQIVAEGVEQPAQAKRLHDAGAHIGQGHLWAPALRIDQIRAVLAAGGQLGPAAQSGISSNGAGSIPTQHHGRPLTTRLGATSSDD